MKYRLLLLLETLKSLFCLIFSRAKNRVILIGTPLHGNLGDHAIALSLCDLFNQNNIQFVEVLGAVYRKFPNIFASFITKTDTICICGGGFLGSLWTVEDDMVLSVLEKFKNNKIIIAPQSIFFYENDVARIERTKTIYTNCKDLTVFLRENNSYELCKILFADMKIKIQKCPDIVFSLNFTTGIEKTRENKVLLCFRTDKEQVLSDFDEKLLKEKIVQKKLSFEDISTVVPYAISSVARKREVLSILCKIASSKLVITDRLHAMIFCYITETPCIVFDNISRKVSGVYEWIKDCDYIRYCATFDVEKIDFNLKGGKRKDFSIEFAPLLEELGQCTKIQEAENE